MKRLGSLTITLIVAGGFVAALTATMAGCGQKGPLTLPGAASAPARSAFAPTSR